MPPQFVSQPFLVGDRVDIATSSGSKALSGTVERIDPMRTILRTDHDVPITIPNKASGVRVSPGADRVSVACRLGRRSF